MRKLVPWIPWPVLHDAGVRELVLRREGAAMKSSSWLTGVRLRRCLKRGIPFSGSLGGGSDLLGTECEAVHEAWLC
ncbi:MAG: hypothetical protein CL927_10935 [Deltaproteobacteria bacterium]|nr:hypothetical protein [Deltaproteobacteria bacterium]HCH66341.1 hypothetical protein [Deltaproteobacteria bacterium]